MCFSRNIHVYHFFLYMNDHFYVVYSADGQISISLKLKFAHNIAGIMDISHSFQFNLLMLTLIFLFKFSSFFFQSSLSFITLSNTLRSSTLPAPQYKTHGNKLPTRKSTWYEYCILCFQALEMGLTLKSMKDSMALRENKSLFFFHWAAALWPSISLQ